MGPKCVIRFYREETRQVSSRSLICQTFICRTGVKANVVMGQY